MLLIRYRVSAEDACIQISNQVERYNTHRGLYDAINQVVKNGDAFPETEVDRHVAKLFLLDFQQSGIHLDETSRELVVDLNDEILQLGQTFGSNAHSPVVIDKTSVPSNIRHFFPQQGDKIILTGYHVDSPTELAKEAAFKMYYWDDPEKEHILRRLLEGRNQLAKVCSYDTFAERAMLESLAQDPTTVKSFLGRHIKYTRSNVSHYFY